MDKSAILELIAYSLDAVLTPAEQEQLDEAFAKYPELLKERAALLQMRQMLGDYQKLNPSETFVNTLLEKMNPETISQKSSTPTLFVRLFPKVAAACVIVLLTALMSLSFGESEWTTDNLLGTTDITADEAYTLINEQ